MEYKNIYNQGDKVIFHDFSNDLKLNGTAETIIESDDNINYFMIVSTEDGRLHRVDQNTQTYCCESAKYLRHALTIFRERNSKYPDRVKELQCDCNN